jgi:molybdopterin converting factor subunit 1
MQRSVTVLYFASARELAGTSEARVTLSDDIHTIADLSAHLEQVVVGLAGRLGTVRFAINEAFVSADARIADGDVIAVIPPVSGG